MKKLILISMFVFLGTSVSHAKAGNAKAGKAKSMTCIACHGATGKSVNPMYPHLAGQHEAYLLKQLKAFKSGVRKDPMMAPMIKSLSETDMENLAAFFSKQK